MYLETERLILRDFTTADLDQFALLMADVEVMRFSLNGPMSREAAKQYLENRILRSYEKYGFGLWALIDKTDRRLIGLAGLLIQNIDGEEKIELGYRLSPGYWGQGLASEACKAVIIYAFEELKLKQLISIIDLRNIRSAKVAERMEMTLLKETIYHGFSVKIFTIFSDLIN